MSERLILLNRNKKVIKTKNRRNDTLYVLLLDNNFIFKSESKEKVLKEYKKIK